MHYYKFHIGDYAGHTNHLDEIEDLAYRRMLDYLYLNEIPLPESIEEIARLIRMRTHCERIQVVLREFFTQTEIGEWVNKRVIAELAEIHGKSEKAQESARKRWEKHHANASESHNGRNAIQEPRTKNQEPITNTKDIVSPKAQQGKNGTRLPVDWVLPEAWFDDAMEIGLDTQSISLEAIVFRDYWVGVAGAKGRKADWRATWRNWVRRKAGDIQNKAVSINKKSPYQADVSFVERHTDRSWAEGL